MLDILHKVPSSTWVTAGAAAFVAFAAGLAFSRGVVQQLLNMVSLALGVWAAWHVFTHRTEVFGASAASMNTDRLLLFSAGSGLLTYLLCKGAIHLLAVMGLLRFLGGLAGWKGVLVSALPSGFLLWVAAMGLRIVGNLYGMESAAAVATEGSKLRSQAASVWDRLSKQLDRSLVGSLAEKVDPLDTRATANLARLLILWPEGSVWQKLSQNPKTSKALRHERVQKLGADPKVRACIAKRDFAGLIQLPQVAEAAGHPDIGPVLSSLDLERAMDEVVYKKPPLAAR